MTYDNTKSHKKPEFHPLSRRHIFGKVADGRGSNSPPPSHLRTDIQTYFCQISELYFLKRISTYQKMYYLNLGIL